MYITLTALLIPYTFYLIICASQEQLNNEFKVTYDNKKQRTNKIISLIIRATKLFFWYSPLASGVENERSSKRFSSKRMDIFLRELWNIEVSVLPSKMGNVYFNDRTAMMKTSCP